MNNKEEILKGVLFDIAKELERKNYKQAFRQVKLEFIKDTINDLYNNNYISLAVLLNDDLSFNSHELKQYMLNGASDFKEWSFFGCGMVYNDDLREAFRKSKASGEELLNLQAYCYYKSYCTLAHLITVGLLKYEK